MIRKITTRIAKGIGILLVSLISLLILVTLIMQFPRIQNYLAGIAVKNAREKLNTDIELEKIRLVLPNSVSLNNFFIKDINGDTMLYFNHLSINVSLFQFLFKKEVIVNSVHLSGVNANITKAADSTFNFMFSGLQEEKKEEPKKESNIRRIGVNDIYLNDIHLKYIDNTSGNKIFAKIGDLKVLFKFSDILNQYFDINRVELQNSDLSVLIDQKRESSEDTVPSLMNIKLRNNLSIKNTNIDFNDRTALQKIIFKGGEIILKPDEIDYASKKIGIKSLLIGNTKVEYEKGKSVENQVTANKTSVEDTGSFDWQIWADELKFEKNNLIYDDNNNVPVENGIDFNHLNIIDLDFTLNDILVEESNYNVTIEKFNFREKSGFALIRFSSEIAIREKEASIKKLKLKTSNSEINNSTIVRFEDLNSLKNALGDAFVKVSFTDTQFGIRDVQYFQPSLIQEINPDVDFITFTGEFSGEVKNLNIAKLLVEYGQNSINAEGNITGLPQIKKADFDMNLNVNAGNTPQILSFLPDSAVPENLVLPHKINLEANVSGAMNDLKGNADISSSQGNLSADFKMSRSDFLDKTNFNATINSDYDLGALLSKADTLGNIDFTAHVEGTTGETTEVTMKIDIHSVSALQYTYNNFSASGTLVNDVLEGSASIHDENIKFLLNLSLDFSDSLPVVSALFNLQAVNLQAINLMKEDMRVKGVVKADIEGINPDAVNGEILFSDFLFIKNGKENYIDELKIEANTSDSISEININSAFLNAHYKGSPTLSSLPGVIKNHLNNYISLENMRDDSVYNDYFEFSAKITNTRVLSDFLIPGLVSFAPSEITAKYNENNMNMDVEIDVPGIVFNALDVNSFNLSIKSNENRLEYNTGFDRLSFNSFLIDNTSIKGAVSNDSLYAALNMKDSLNQERYLVNSVILKNQEGYVFRIQPDVFLLNYDTWNLPFTNYILFGSNGIELHDMVLEKGRQKLSVSTPTGSSETGPITFEFTALQLADILSAVQSGKEIISGELNGNFDLEKDGEGMTFISDLYINDLYVFQNELFKTVSIKAQKTNENTITLLSTLVGEKNDIKIEGKYRSQNDKNSVDILTEIKQIDLSTLEPILSGQFNTLKGILRGRVNVEGDVSDPDIAGNVQFDEVIVNPVLLNAEYKIDNEEITIGDKRIELDNFTVKDQSDNVADFNGFVSYKDSGIISFNLDAVATDFILLNTKETDDNPYYGNVIADLTANVSGNSKRPVINVNATIKNESEFYYTVVNTGAVSIEKEGIVEFIHKDTLAEEILEKYGAGMMEIEENPVEMDFTANIEIKDNTLFKVVIDPTTNENLTIRGEGNLGFSMKPNRDIIMTGRYEINEGSYMLSFFNVVKRNFTIDKGSYLTWSGDPLGANADISAIYSVRTTPLMPESEQELSDAKREFLVYLNIKGDLLSPEIDFDIKLPEGEENAMIETQLNRLNQNESELNKQVFSLLIFKNFLSGQPSSKPVSYEINETARNGISNILSQQLNNFAQQYIKGFDVSFDLNSYAANNNEEFSGNTELEVDISKEFFNERLSVQVGGNVGIEGSDNEPGDDMNGITGDLVIEYNLTKDGIYKLQGFDKSEYEDIIDGRIRKTGIAFIFNKEFESFKGLFGRKKEKKMKLKEQNF